MGSEDSFLNTDSAFWQPPALAALSFPLLEDVKRRFGAWSLLCLRVH